VPTVEEKLEGTVRWIQESLEHDCPPCAGTGGAYTPEPGRCEHCGGSGKTTYPPHAPQVQHGVNNAAVSGMYQTRQDGDFDRMNRILDWVYAYNLRVAAQMMSDMSPEALQSVGDKLQKAEASVMGHASKAGVQFAHSPIPADELEALIREHDAEQEAEG